MKVLRWLLLLCAPVCFAQGTRYDSNVFTSASNVPYGARSALFTIPFSTITVCAYPDDGGHPCTNTIPVWQDQAETVPQANPFRADVYGRFGFWLSPGTYTYSVVSSGGTFLGTYIFTLGGSGGTGCTLGSVANTAVVFNNAGNCAGSVNFTANSSGYVNINGNGGTGYLFVESAHDLMPDNNNTSITGDQIDISTDGADNHISPMTANVSDQHYSGGNQGMLSYEANNNLFRAGKDSTGYDAELSVDSSVAGRTATGYLVDTPSLGSGASLVNVYGFRALGFGNKAGTEEFANLVETVDSVSINSNYCSAMYRDRTGALHEKLDCGPNHANTFAGPVTIGSTLTLTSLLTAPLTTPASSSAACTAGTVAWDANFIYVCTATNTFKRVALSTF